MLVCVCVCVGEQKDGMTHHLRQARHEDQAKYIKRTIIQKHFIEHFHKIHHIPAHITAYSCVSSNMEPSESD